MPDHAIFLFSDKNEICPTDQAGKLLKFWLDLIEIHIFTGHANKFNG